MAEKKSAADSELDDKGNPISDGGEGGGIPPKIKSESDEDKEAEPEIPVRKSVLQHIIARKNRTIERLRSKDDEDDEDLSLEKDIGDEEDEDTLTPEARGAVQKEVARAIGPVVKSLASKADEDELSELLANEPQAAKYEKRIRAYMEHPHYKGVPPSVIFHHLAFDDAATIGTRRKKAADTEAGQVRGGGRPSRTIESGTGDIPSADEQNEMSDADFEALQNRARSGEFVKREE